ncbi:hypothetical protein AURDEDRAFT_156812 [Auricularia subglabra TFB-10046 SS5]|nr:hypothetical protein AURDEDRAFT_156812 [Auricularia subglabra TFB-10046 SS5]
MSSPAPSAFDGGADRSSVELLDFVPGRKPIALKKEHDDTRPFAFRPAGRVNDREWQAAPSRRSSLTTGAQPYVSPFGRPSTQQAPAPHGHRQQAFFPSAHGPSASFSQPSPTSVALHASTAFKPSRIQPAPEDAPVFSQRRPSDRSARPESSDSGGIPPDMRGRSATRAESVERNADVVNLLWEKVKERETAIALKDAEIAELVDLKDNAVKELAAVKTLAKDAVATSAKRLEEVHAQMELLKNQASATFPSAEAVRESLVELRDLKQTIRVVLDELEPLLVPGEGCLENQVAQTKFVVRELQLSLQTKQQIADVLRDRVDQAMIELSEAKVKFQALEDCQNRRIVAEKQHAEQLRDISANMAALADALASEKEKLLDVTKNAERLQAANDRLVHENTEKEALLDRQDAREQELANVKLELALLENEGQELRARAEALRSVSEELATCKLQLHDAFATSEKLREQSQAHRKDRDSLQEQLSDMAAEHAREVSNRTRIDDAIQAKEKEVACLTEKLADMSLVMTDEGKKRGALEQDIRVVQHERDGFAQQVSVLQDQLRAAEVNTEQTRSQLLAATAQAASALQSITHHEAIIHALRAELSEQKAASDAVRDARTALQVETVRLQQRSQELEFQLTESTERLATSTARTGGLQERIEGLQERLEGQAIGLRGTLEELATLRDKASQQEAELAVQTALSHALRSDCEKVEQQRAADWDVLEKIRLSMESLQAALHEKDVAIEQLRSDLSASREERANVQTNLELARGKEALLAQQLAGREKELALRCEGWESQRAQMNGVIHAAQLREDDLSKKLAELQKMPASPRVDSMKEKEALEMLAAAKLNCQRLDNEIASLKNAASTLGDRYDKKLLTPEEKDVVSRIAKDARAIYEQELLLKNNELKKRENISKELSARNQLLEEKYAILAAQNRAAAAPPPPPPPPAAPIRTAPAPVTQLNNVQNTQRHGTAAAAAHPQSRPVRATAVSKAAAPGPTPTVRFQDMNGSSSSDPSYRLPSSPSQASDDWDTPPTKTTKKRPAPAQAAKGAETAKRVRTTGQGSEAKVAEKPRKGKANATAAKTAVPDAPSAAVTKTRTRKRASATG